MKILTGFFLKHQTSKGCFAYPKLRPRAATKITSTETTNTLNPVLDTKQSSNLRHIFLTFEITMDFPRAKATEFVLS